MHYLIINDALPATSRSLMVLTLLFTLPHVYQWCTTCHLLRRVPSLSLDLSLTVISPYLPFTATAHLPSIVIMRYWIVIIIASPFDQLSKRERKQVSKRERRNAALPAIERWPLPLMNGRRWREGEWLSSNLTHEPASSLRNKQLKGSNPAT